MKIIFVTLIALSILEIQGLKAQNAGVHTDTLTIINGFLNWRAEGAGINFKKTKNDSIFYKANPDSNPMGMQVDNRMGHRDSLWYTPRDYASYYIRKKFIGKRFIVSYTLDSIENPVSGANMLGINNIYKMILIK